jgi:UDP-N-acetylglucosamine 4-epimerase
MSHRSPVINGDGSFSRDFTYIDNVIQANQLAAITPTAEFKNRLEKFSESIEKPYNPESTISEVFNVAYGERTTLKELVEILKVTLSNFDSRIGSVEILNGPNRGGDIPHSLASIDKASQILEYLPKYGIKNGLNEAIVWYWNNLG